MPARVSMADRRKYIQLRKNGFNQKDAYEKVGISKSTAMRIDAGLSLDSSKNVVEEQRDQDEHPDPRGYADLSANGKRAVDSFPHFAGEFMQLETPGYWGECAEELDRIAKLGAFSQEFLKVLMTFHPGAGKTTMIHAYCFWRIMRARALGDFSFSVMFGSKTQALAKRIIRMITWHADHNVKMIAEFGRIRPVSEDGETTWTKTEIMFAGMGGGNKDATLTVWGIDQSIVGIRPKLACWDDIVEKKNADPTNTESLKQQWDGEADTRLEPGGVMVVTGHFFTPNDFYHVLKNQVFIEDDGTETRVWKHYAFKAHDDARCPVVCGTGTEHTEYPAGCLLWPKRFGIRHFQYHQQKNPSLYALQYQSEDGVSEDVLVPKLWSDGGVDDHQNVYPGCKDVTPRALGRTDLPFRPKESRGVWSDTFLASDWPEKWDFTLACLDPSPTKYAVVTVTCFDSNGPYHHLVGYIRRRMTTEEYPAVIEALTLAIRERDPEFNTWVVEKTGAEYLHGAESMKDLPQRLKIQIVAHETRGNKSHPEYGIWAHRAEWQFGRVRIPWGSPRTQERMRQFVEEHNKYPFDQTDDCVLSFWFYFLHRPNVEFIAKRRREGVIRRWTPSWMKLPDGVRKPEGMSRADQAGLVGSGVRLVS